MFTGIVTDVGIVEIRTANRAAGGGEGGLSLGIRSAYDELAVGESLAVNGACLTVVDHTAGRFKVDVVPTTLERTLFGDLAVGDRVNLERALEVGDRLGGHLVQGHVDGIGTVTDRTEGDGTVLVDLTVPSTVWEVSVPLGSVTVDGVSLTVNALPGPELVQVSLIPFTLDHTTLGTLRPGRRVHLEGDVIGKYVRRLMDARGTPEA